MTLAEQFTCKGCGGAYERKSCRGRGAGFCTKRCYRSNQHKRVDDTSALIPKTCPVCKVSFVCATRQQHQQQVYCKASCWRVFVGQKRKSRETAERANRQAAAAMPRNRSCTKCRHEFTTASARTVCDLCAGWRNRNKPRECCVCAVTFRVVDVGRWKYCSDKCQELSRQRKCMHCAKLFSVRDATSPHTCCSILCGQAFRRGKLPVRSCIQCDKPLASRVARVKYCNRQCASAHVFAARLAQLAGQRFGKLVVQAYVGIGANGVDWDCLCDCGTRVLVHTGALCSGGRQSCGCAKHAKGPENKNWKGRIETKNGYIYLWAPQHPGANSLRYVAEHRLVMERVIGRNLARQETVHHKNGIRDDNRPENLELWTKTHPNGVRQSDLVDFCKKFLRSHGEST